MEKWKTKVVCAGRYRPRQFEYHPLHEDTLVFGTVRGEAVVVDLSKNIVSSSISSGLSKDKRDSILGLCWLKHRPNHFVVGSSNGFLRLCESGPLPSTSTEEYPTSLDMSGDDWMIQPRYKGFEDTFCPLGARIVKEFGRFERLTSVHVNSTDDHMLVSGYTFGVSLFDISTSSVVRDFQDIHGDHINISRFANHSPFVFATSSFDCTVKAWDSRMPSETPIYTCQSDMGHVMLSFSPDDGFLLTSAVDNEVKQYLAVDGTLYMDLDLPRTGLDENFTRSYYTSSGRMILSGSSEEQMVRLYCSQTGRMVHEAVMYPGRKHGSLYVQSLRGDPHHDHRFSVLVNYRDPSYPLEIINVDMLKGSDGEDLRSPVVHATTDRLSSDLGRACRMTADADIYMVARNRLRFAAHKAILSCRCRVLGELIDKAVAKRSGRVGVGASKETGADVQPNRQPHLKTDHMEEDDVFMDLGLISVYLPRAVAPEIVPVVLEYLYTDKLNVETVNEDYDYARAYIDPGTGDISEGDTPGDAHQHAGRSKGRIESTARARALMMKRSSGQPTPSEKVTVFEKLLEAANALQLERLSCLVEWQCSQLVDTVTVVDLAKMALRLKREQLLQFCVHFLVSHLGAVFVLHGNDCLPLHLKIKVDAERERRQYALNRGPENPGMSLGLTRDASALQHTHQMAATGATGAAPTGVGGQGSNGSNAGHGGNTLGAALAAAAAAVSAALGNVQAVGGGQGGGGAAPAMGAAAAQAPAEVGAALPNIANGASAQNGHGGFEANGYHGFGEADDDDDEDGDEGVMDDDDDDLEDDDDDMGDEDDIVDEEVDSTMSGDDLGEDDEGPWIDPSQCGENLSADVRRRLVPSSNGHSGTAVFGSHMVVIGGNNRRQVHSCRHVLLYDPVERSWSKMPTRGNAPSCLVYHSCTELEPPWGVQRNLLIIGGPRQVPRRSKAPVLVLDCLTMEWSRPVISGRCLADRTRHTAVAVFSEDLTDHDLGRGSGDQTPDQWFRHPSADDEDLTAAGRGKWDKKTDGLGRARDDGGETNVIIFGGYTSTQNGEVFNDVVVLNVIRLSREQGHGRSDKQPWTDPDDSLASEDEDVPSYLDEESCLDYDDDEGKNICTRSSHGYRYRWVWPMVLGTPPAARLAHAAAVVRISERGDSFLHGGRGREASKRSRNVSYMVVFGGVGEEDVFNDVGVLKCTGGMEWITVQVNGRRPARRFGHSMVALTSGNSENYGKLAVFGGTSGRYIFNDLFLLTINPGTDVNGVPRVKADWEHLARRTLGVMPSPRSRLSMCLIKGELIIFGGTDQTTGVNNVEPLHREVDSFVYHVRPRIFGRCLPRSLATHEGTAAFHLTATGNSVAFRHGGGGSSSSSSGASFGQRRQVHERAMAREVASRMSMVQAAEIRRTTTAACCAERLEKELFHPMPESPSDLVEPDVSTEVKLTREEAGVITEQSAQRSLGDGVMGNLRAFSGHGSRFSWQVSSPFGDTSAGGSGMRTHEPRMLRHPHLSEWSGARSRSFVHILWESIRPQVFVWDAGPEPPIYAPPSVLHVEMGSLIGNTKFSDVEFRLQAIDYTLPTTPTNTAHYAIVPPLTPPTLTTASLGVSPKDTKCPPSPFSFSFPDQQPTHGIASSIASGASSMTYVRADTRPRTSTAPSVLPRGDGHALGGPLESFRDRRSIVHGASRVGDSDVLGGNMTRAHRGGIALPISPDSASPLHYRRHDANRRISRANANGGDGAVVGADELARQSRSSPYAAVPSPSSRMAELFALSPLGASRGEGGGRGWNNRGSSPVRASSGDGLRLPTGAFGCASSTSESGPVEKVWQWECGDGDRALAGGAEVEEKYDVDDAWLKQEGMVDKAATARSSAGNPQANGMSFSPSSTWEVLAELVLCTSPSTTDSACSSAENRRRFDASFEVGSYVEENHAAPRGDVGWVGEEGVLRNRKGVSANGGSGTERFHAHRFVVALRSDPMRAMLQSGMKETFDRDALVKDIRPSVFSSLLTYIYTDNLQLERPQDIMELLVVANQYTLGELVCLCEGFLQGVLDEDNVCHLYHYADALGMPTFEHRVLTFILRNWGRVTRTEGWRVLPEELRVRANNFRTRETHIFMLNHKDHVKWEGDWKMANWVYEKARIPSAPASPEEKDWCDEVLRVRNKVLSARLITDERRRNIRNMTAGE